MRRGWFVLIMCGAVAGLLACPLSAPAAGLERAKPVSRADHIAAALLRDPVYITDHAPRVTPPDAAERIRASVARLGVPVFVAVTPTIELGSAGAAEDLVALLRDRMRKNGIYIVMSPTTSNSEVRQFGGARRLPVEDAWRATRVELPSDATAPEQVERFVGIALSGKARERAERQGPRPKTELRKKLDADDAADRRATQVEWGVFGGGAALSGIPILVALVIRRVRRANPPPNKNQAKKKQTGKKQTKKPANRKQEKKPAKGRR